MKKMTNLLIILVFLLFEGVYLFQKVNVFNKYPKLSRFFDTKTLLVDNYDSYTYNIYQILSKVNNIEPDVIYNDEKFHFNFDSYDNIVLSPGPGSPSNHQDFGICREILLDPNLDIPILGVCLGHQGMSYLSGGEIERCSPPMHGRLSSVFHLNKGVFLGIPQGAYFVRYHSLKNKTPIPNDFEEVAWTHDGINMGIQHKVKPRFGVQFHPESILSKEGWKIFHNFEQITLSRRKYRQKDSNKFNPFINFSSRKNYFVQRPKYSIEKSENNLFIYKYKIPINTGEVDLFNLFKYFYANSSTSFWLDSGSSRPVSILKGENLEGSYVDPPERSYSFFGDMIGHNSYSVEYFGNNSLIKREFNGSNVSSKRINKNIFEFIRSNLLPRGVHSDHYNLVKDKENKLVPSLSSDSNNSAAFPCFSDMFFGYLGYDVGKEAINILESGLSNQSHYDLSQASRFNSNRHSLEAMNFFSNTPISLFLRPSLYLAYDHKNKSIYIVSSINKTMSDITSLDFNQTNHLLNKLDLFFNASESIKSEISKANLSDRFLEARQSKDQYIKDINKCLDYISDGESYEICLTTKFSGPIHKNASSLQAYRDLRQQNPAPYSFYLNYHPFISKSNKTSLSEPAGFSICSTSPECFLKASFGGVITSKPIKGTEKRNTQNPSEDLEIAQQLQRDEKSRSENLMIVDLIRNDLGRVCEIGSVNVTNLMDIETFAFVHQMVSTIQGTLCHDKDLVDALIATFPGGSMTGAPKIRTMDIIERLEGQGRGIYSGSFGYFGSDGSADFNIIIRTALFQNCSISIGAGGAIIHMSDPGKEAEEVLLKASSVAQALGYQVRFR